MYTEEEFKQAINICLNQREKEIIKAKFGVDVELMLLEDIFTRYGTNINEIRDIEKRITNFINKNGYDPEKDKLQRVLTCVHDEYRPLASEDPNGFIKFVPIFKCVEIDNIIYAVTHLKQYLNGSVVCIEIEFNTAKPLMIFGHINFELFISPEYHCRSNGGFGQGRGMHLSFVVTPSLPDKINGIEFHLNLKSINEKDVSFAESSITIK
ncbi:MAG: hypothetical protein GX434_08110 [Peptococcaceae bacterium]|nr:hypothetical protein [Peptococcaceae bacterium]